MRRLLSSLLVLFVGLGLVTAAYAGPYGATQCAASRFGSDLGCNAKDVQLNSITVAGTPPASCVGGSTLPLSLDVQLNFGSASRYDVGVFLSNNGQDPALTSATSCSVAAVPTSSPFWGTVASGGDGDLCGDGGSNLTAGFAMASVTVPCTTDGSGSFKLYIPYVISWDQQDSNYCGDYTYPVPGTTSKCNMGTVNFPPGATIVVLPVITITDGITVTKSGDTLTYTVVITNTTGSPLSGAIFTDPAVANLSVSSVTCPAAATGGATCPASATVTVAAMQGAGITLPSMPINSSLTFTVAGTVGAVTSPTVLTNTAKVTVSGQTNTASDTDTILAPPTVSKTFSTGAIAPNGTSTLSITLSNPNAVPITGVAFTDSYPANLKNAAIPGLTNSCGGTATAAANGSSLALSGGSIPVSSCTLTVQVTASATVANTIASVTTGNAGSSTSATATLQVVSAANSTVVANPTSVANDGASTSLITVTLMDTAGNPVANKTITLSAGSGSSVITTLSGTTNAFGQATFTVKDTIAEVVTYTAIDTTDSVTITQTATVTYSSITGFNAFETSTAAGAISGQIYTKLAGTSFGLDAVAVSGGSPAGTFNGSISVDLLANTGATGSGYGADNCPIAQSLIPSSTASAQGSWSSGRRNFSFPAISNAYRDVRVRITYAGSPAITVCSNDSFAIRPSAVTLLTSATAVAPSALDPLKIPAGTAFDLAATTSTGTNYAGTLTLDSTKLAAQDPASATQQVGGVVGTLSSPTTLTANVLASGNASYSEVGYLYLGPGAYRDDAYTSVDQGGDCISNAAADANVDGIPDYLSDVLVNAKYGCSVGNALTVSLGRFIPYEFRASSPMLTNRQVAACAPASTFSYLDEGIGLGYTLEARSATGNITKNYAGLLAKLTLPATGSTMNFATAVVGPPFVSIASSRIVGSSFTGAWPAVGSASAGQVVLAGTLTISSLNSPAVNRVSPDGPFTNAAIGIAPVDSDGVRIMTYDLDSDNSGGVGGADHLALATTSLYFGEIRLLPAIGSERLPLTMSAEILRWNGAGFVPNGNDSCTQIPAARLALSGWTKNLGSGETTLPVSALTFASGRGALRLAAPGAGNDGTVLVTADLTGAGLAYLTGRWGGATRYIQNPSAIAAFGLYKGAGQIIHFRENY